MPNWKKVIVSGSIAKLANETFISGHITASGTVKAEHFISTDDALIGDDLVVNGDIDLDGSIDVNGTANLDVVDIDGAVNMATTALVTGVLTTTAIQVVNGGLALATNKKVQFRDSAIYINSDADGHLELVADTGISFKIGSTEQIILTDGALTPTTNNDIDLGKKTHKFKNLFLQGDITASGHAHIVGDITSSAIIKAEHLFSTDDALITDDLVVGGNIDLEGDIDVNGTANLDAVDIDGNVDIAGTTAINDAMTIATNKKLIFRDSAIHISSTADGDLAIAADDEIDITSTLIDINGNVDISGTALVTGVLTTTAIQVVNGGLALATDKKVQFRDSAVYINSDADGYLEAVADTGITFKIGSTEQVLIADGKVEPTTTNDIDLGSAAKKFKNLFLTGDITASGHVNVVGDITSSAIISAEHLFSSDDAEITDNLVVGGDIDLEGAIDVNGTANLDVVDIDGAVDMASTALVTGVLTTTATQVVNGGLQIADGQEIIDTSENTIIEFADDAVTFSCGSTTINGIATIAKRKWARSSTTNNNLTQGDITFTGGEGTIATGDIVYMDTSGNWQKAQANSLTKSKGILGIALGNNAGVNGILLRGMFTLDHDVGNNQGIPLFLSDTTAGQAIIAAPDTSGDIVRIIGYNLGNDDQIWFSPDNTFVEVA